MNAAAIPAPELPVLAESHEALRVGSRSFSLAAKLLPASQRDDAAVVYALCRLVDDVADDGGAHAAADLARLEREVLGQATPRPLVAAFRDLAQRTGLDVACMVELIGGCASDQQAVRIPDDAALVRYGYRVAGTVGLMMCAVTGVTDPTAHPHAVDLGVAMQLTNICRDVAEDARMGRVYLPASRLARHGITHQDLLDGSADRAAVARVVLELLDLAELYYESAMDGIHHIPWPARVAILAAARVYRQIGVKLRRSQGDALAGRTVVGLAERLLQVGVAMTLALSPRTRGAAGPVRHRRSLHLGLEGLPGANA
jgi:phytoene synthase